MFALPAAPASLLNAAGEPHFGRFAGSLAHIDWQGVASPWQRSAWWRRFHHKRWHYIALATEEIFCGVAIVDLGWACTAFAYVFEGAAKSVIHEIFHSGIWLACVDSVSEVTVELIPNLTSGPSNVLVRNVWITSSNDKPTDHRFDG